MGEGAAAFLATPHVPGGRARCTEPQSRRTAGAPRCWSDMGSGLLAGTAGVTRAVARWWGLLGTGCPRPTEAPAALPYRSAWVHVDL